MIPEWAPNIHPLVVHFPIALISIAVLFNLGFLIFHHKQWLKTTTTLLYGITAISSIITYLTGRQAADSVSVPPSASPVLSTHSDWALWTVWYFGVIAAIWIVILWREIELKRFISIPLFLLGLGAFAMVFQTADRGGRLVYLYGVGVQINEDEQLELSLEPKDEDIIYSENGSWQWVPQKDADKVLANQFNWLAGNVSDLNPEMVLDPTYSEVLALYPKGTQVLLVAGDSVADIQMDVTLGLDEFSGKFALVHHVQDKLTYDFIVIENGTMKLGRISNGAEDILQEKPVKIKGWQNLRAIGAGRHFKGYLNDSLITHGHINELPAGQAGIIINGAGTILLKNIQIYSMSR